MSAPPIRIESKAWTDHRYAALALRLGLPSARFALILVADLWCWQTEHYTEDAPTYSVPRAVIEGALGNLQGPEFLVASDLAELEPDGRYRIKGGRDDKGESRIDWLWFDRQQRKNAGKASARKRKAAGDPRTPDGRFADVTDGQPTADQRATNGGPTDTERRPNGTPTSPVSSLQSPDPESLSRAAPAHDPPVPGAMGLLVEHAIDRLNAARRELDPAARNLGVFGDAAGAALLRKHLGTIGEPDRRSTLDHCLDVLIDHARTEGGVGDLRLAMLAGDRSWPRWLAGTVGGSKRAARGRDGPAGRPPTGQARPAASHGTGLIDPSEF